MEPVTRYHGPNATRIFVVEWRSKKSRNALCASALLMPSWPKRRLGAEARDDNWREALAEWAEARDALLAGTPRRRPARTDFDETLHNTLMRPFLGRKAMNWFSRTTSIAGIQVSNWILVIVGAVVIWIIYSFIAH